MTMKFPSKPEIRLRKAPLDEVICQIKFPSILSISKGMPIEFQEAVRARFPELRVEQGVFVQFPDIASSEKPAVDTAPKNFRFLTSDGKSYIALAPDFVALSVKHYTHWGDFQSDLQTATQALLSIYQPSYATRIGVRFINRFTLKSTGCKKLSEMFGLFRPELTCLLRTQAWTEPIEMLSQIILKDEQRKFALRSGFGKDQNEPFFILDFDYYEERQLPLEKLTQRIDRFHSRIYDAFRWCLLDDSLTRFGPLQES